VVHDNIIRIGADTPDGVDRRLFVGGVDKGLQVLRAFYDRPMPLSLTDVAAATGMGRSAAQRFLYTLKTLGYLRQNPSTRRYTLSPRVLDFGFAYLRNDSLVEKSFTYLLDASKRTDETVNLTELDGTEVIYVSRFPSRKVISVDIILGARLPVYCTAPGRAMLSQMAPADAEAIIARSDRVARTPFTEVAPDRIMARGRGAAPRLCAEQPGKLRWRHLRGIAGARSCGACPGGGQHRRPPPALVAVGGGAGPLACGHRDGAGDLQGARRLITRARASPREPGREAGPRRRHRQCRCLRKRNIGAPYRSACRLPGR
jgi:DNA-binding IclR family transcriptional regulator